MSLCVCVCVCVCVWGGGIYLCSVCLFRTFNFINEANVNDTRARVGKKIPQEPLPKGMLLAYTHACIRAYIHARVHYANTYAHALTLI